MHCMIPERKQNKTFSVSKKKNYFNSSNSSNNDDDDDDNYSLLSLPTFRTCRNLNEPDSFEP